LKQLRGLLFSIFFLLLTFNCMHAQWVKTGGLYGGSVYSFASIGNTLFAGTASGVYASSDNGANWSVRNNGLTNLLINKLYADGSQVYAGTNSGLFVSSDYGINWREIDNGIIDKDIRSIFAQDNLILAGTFDNGVFFSSNSGANWSTTSLQNLNIYAIAKMGETLYASTGVSICRSTDSGENWIWPTTWFSNVRSIAVLGTKIFASTIDRGIYCSTDRGDTWFQTNTGLPDDYQMLQIQSIVAHGTNLYAGTGDGVFVSTDEGVSWHKAGTIGKDHYALNLFEMGNNLFAGTYGGIFISSDSGARWTAVNNRLTNAIITSIVSVDNYLFAATQGNGLMESTDNGNNWFQCDNGLNQFYIPSLAVIGKHIFAASEDGIFVSSNYGANWTKTNAEFDFPGFIPLSADGTNLFVEGMKNIFVTSDYGNSWTETNSQIGGKNIYYYTRSGGFILASTGNCDYYFSPDNGNSWIPVTYLKTYKKGACSFLVSGSTILIGTTSGILISADKGANWAFTTIGSSSDDIKALAASGKYLFAGTYENGVFISADNGLNWKQINTGLTYFNINNLAVAGNNLFAGMSGGIWKRSLSEILTPIEESKSELPVAYTLAQNYPNPFNPTTTISYTVPSNSFVSLKVHDALGREVAVLVNEVKAPGSYKVNFNGSGLSSGIYFYHIQAGIFTDTKKLVLLK
jgi:photosystem II stability/assembly factor-like uncharacterized protein